MSSSTSQHQLEKSSQQLEATRRTALETEEIAVGTLEELRKQRQQILQVKNKTEQVDNNLNQANKTLNMFSTMHGVLVKDKKELTDAEKEADLAAGNEAMNLLKSLIKSKRDQDMSALDKTLEILKLNPELGLAWNFRREIILSALSVECLLKELELLNSVMVHQQMTKSYCLWNHRRWILLKLKVIEGVDDSVIDKELNLVSTILQLDSRNFHSWSYRKWLCDNFPISDRMDDVAYSLSLIGKDFSNYSAWFLRRRAFERIGEIPNPMDELELVWNALFTEPTDQSCWQYHDWLLEREYERLHEQDARFMCELEEVVDDKDSKYLLLSKLRNHGADERQEILENLARIDPMRKGYYMDQMISGK